MSAEAQMQLLGEHDGARWYWAAPGMFHFPGVYYWDGDDNVRVEKAQPAPAPQAPGRRNGSPGITLEPQGHESPAAPVVSDGVKREQINALLNDDSQDSKEMHDFARAILALRPAVEPMTPEQINEMALQEEFLLVCDGVEELTEIVRAVEAHHFGITAKAEGGT